MSAGGPALSVIVPATNAPPTLGRCRAAIQAGLAEADELIVVEKAGGPGPAAARNSGAERATGDVLVFVDADVVPHPDALTRIRAAFAADPGLTGLFGSYDDSPEAPGAVSGFRNLLHHHVHQSSVGAVSTFWAGLGGVRRPAFEAVGGFDERAYPAPSIEDIELGTRLRGRGGRIELDPDLQGTHLKRWTLLDMVRTDFARRGVPWVALLAETRRNGAGAIAPTGLNLGWRHRASAAATLALLLFLLRGHPWRAIGTAALLVALNRSLYALILRRRGALQAAAAVGLHAVHHLTAAASVPAGLAAHGISLAPTPYRTAADDGEREAQGSPRGPLSVSPRGSLANLVVIGAQKCGTSSLHRYLDLHPEISMSRIKELDFFLQDENWFRGTDWYARQFDSTAKIRGESSPNYTNLPISEGAAERMHDAVPEARLIYLVRDPIERALSHYVHSVGLGREERSADEALSDPESRYVRRSLYRTQIEPFVERFGRQRILVATQEDLLEDRAETLRRIFRFLEVEESFTSPWFERRWEVSAGKDRKFRAAYRLSRLIGGKDFWGRVPPRLRWALERVAYGRVGESVAAPLLGDPVREALVERFRPEVEWLRRLTGQELAGWSV